MIPLFELLKMGLGQECLNAIDILPSLTKKDWKTLRRMADKQGVSAIAFDGLNRAIREYGRENICPAIDHSWWKAFVIDWIGLSQKVKRQNAQQLLVMEEMANKWTYYGCRVMVMKGQANGTFYPKPESRSPGDIDCYLFENYAKGNDIAREVEAKVDESWYKHSVISYKGETFENHQFFVHTRDGKRSKLLEKELEEALKVDKHLFAHLTKSVVKPPVQWTAMFLTYHACAHFISEGLRLKQLLDWAMFLNTHQGDVDWQDFYSFCDRHHLRRFADAATAICVDYLGLIITRPDITTTSPFSERILNSTLYDEDYVFSSGKSGWQNRLHIIKNLWRYQWKYKDIYEESIWRQLWYYFSGYTFHTE